MEDKNSLVYRVTRNGETEPPFSGEYNNFKKEGFYSCVNCNSTLFSSKQKFESGSGWPSFYDLVDKSLVKEIEDNSYGMKRIEVKCRKCNSHLGHVFADGPRPTGLRYCINSVSLKFEDNF
tara:strand:- start:37 stop:399 length:363 start_codon:yes stop_codon:yes gene_type:complete